MSGFVGVFGREGTTAGRELLETMVRYLERRGPDRKGIWMAGAAGLGHTLLQTTEHALREEQPCSIDGKTWIVADARLDAREELIRELKLHGREVNSSSAEPDLLLHAFATWGVGCIQHLLGDFAFAIWDAQTQSLFCARDQLGVKPFYYVETKTNFAISNSLDCLRLLSGVSSGLNELAIAESLIFDLNQDPTATSFSDIHRLPPAHTLEWNAAGLRTRRYWTLPIEGPLRYRREADAVEEFRALLDVAVADRMRTDRVGVFFSGGLDSTSVAAAALAFSQRQDKRCNLHAFTVSHDGLFDDPEGGFAKIAADALGIPIHFTNGANFGLFERWEAADMRKPEPDGNPLASMNAQLLRSILPHSRVILTGYGGDNLLHPQSGPYLFFLLLRGRLDRAAAEFGGFVFRHRQIPPLLLGIRSRLHKWARKEPHERPFPDWIAEELANRHHLRERWKEQQRPYRPQHPFRPEAYESMVTVYWPAMFEWFDPGFTGAAVEQRHPLMDLRLVRMLLSLPPVPYCVEKQLMREAAGGRLPEVIRTRKKVPLQGDPVRELLHRPESAWLDRVQPHPEFARFVRRERIPPVADPEYEGTILPGIRALALDFWLKTQFPTSGDERPSAADPEPSQDCTAACDRVPGSTAAR